MSDGNKRRILGRPPEVPNCIRTGQTSTFSMGQSEILDLLNQHTEDMAAYDRQLAAEYNSEENIERY